MMCSVIKLRGGKPKIMLKMTYTQLFYHNFVSLPFLFASPLEIATVMYFVTGMIPFEMILHMLPVTLVRIRTMRTVNAE